MAPAGSRPRSCWIWHFIGSKHLDRPGNADTRRSLVMSPNARHEGVPTPANRLSRAVLKEVCSRPGRRLSTDENRALLLVPGD